MRKITKSESEELFSEVKKAKFNGVPIVNIFKNFSKKYGYSFGSVRNYYYKTIRESEKFDEELRAKKVVKFTKDQEKELVVKIIKTRKNFDSLNKTLLNIADGDEKLALRYRNKFNNLLNKKRSLVMRQVILNRDIININPYLKRRERLEILTLKREIEDLKEKLCKKCPEESGLLKEKIKKLEKISMNGLFNSPQNSEDPVENKEEDMKNENVNTKGLHDKDECKENKKQGLLSLFFKNDRGKGRTIRNL